MDFLADINNAVPEAALAGFGLAGLLLGAIGGDRASGLLHAQAPKAELVSVEKIWDQAGHNAFTDLVSFKGQLRPRDARRGAAFRARCLGVVHVRRIPQDSADGAV